MDRHILHVAHQTGQQAIHACSTKVSGEMRLAPVCGLGRSCFRLAAVMVGECAATERPEGIQIANRLRGEGEVNYNS